MDRLLFDNPSAPPDASVTELLGAAARTEQTFENDDGTCTVVARLESGSKVRGVVGIGGVLRKGRCYRFLGRWEEHTRYGWQFAFQTYVEDFPNQDGLAAYLAKWIEGVGLVTAGRLVEAYGEDVVRVILDQPERLVEDGHLGDMLHARSASEALAKVCNPALRDAHLELFRLFKGHGFYGKAIKEALARWRERAPEVVRRDPFALLVAELSGCGFLRCDKLYAALRLNPGRLKRQALAAWHALRIRDGDTWLSLGDAYAAIRDQIGGAQPQERQACAMAIRARWLSYRMTDGGSSHWLAERDKAANERDVALRVSSLREGPPLWPAIDEKDEAFERLSPHQREQLAVATSGRVCVLSGTPGTGKTYAAAALIKVLLKVTSRSAIAVCAPTGKAAVRISEKMQEARILIQAQTIHRLLGPSGNDGGKWSFRHHADNPLPFRFVVVDESSMIDVSLAAALLLACGRETHLLFCGDVHQLPPVGHGAFLRDLIAGGIPTAALAEIRRNSGDIVAACARIKEGAVPEMPGDLSAYPEHNLVHLGIGRGQAAEKAAAMRGKVDGVYAWLRGGEAKWNLVDDVQVLCARNVTRQQLNRHLQQSLNPCGARGPSGTSFRVADKVICLRNQMLASVDRGLSEYVMNGELGRVQRFDGQRMVVEFQAPLRRMFIPLKKVDRDGMGEEGSATDFDLGYAITTHKSQGSEWPVIVFLVEGAGKLGSRELLYTGVSRAKELCVLIGERSEIGRYARNVTLSDRKTFLAEMLNGSILP